MTDKKASQFENRQLFRAECKKKTKRGRRKSKGEKAERDAASRRKGVGEARVGSKKYPKEEEVSRGSLEQKSMNPKDYDQDAKVIIFGDLPIAYDDDGDGDDDNAADDDDYQQN